MKGGAWQPTVGAEGCDSGRCSKLHHCGSAHVCMAGSQAIAAGEEVLISYLGEKPSKPNAALMKDYGFVMPGNINDTITFDIAGECVRARDTCTPLSLLLLQAHWTQSLPAAVVLCPLSSFATDR